MFTKPFVQTQNKENIKSPRHWPLWGEFIGDRWIPLTKGQWRGKCFHWMTYSCLSVLITLSVFSKVDRIAHDNVIIWKHFPRYWPFVRGIPRPPVNSPLKGQWRGALMFTLICARINGWVNNREAGDLRRHRSHCGVSVLRVSDIAYLPEGFFTRSPDESLDHPGRFDSLCFIQLVRTGLLQEYLEESEGNLVIFVFSCIASYRLYVTSSCVGPYLDAEQSV